MRTLYTCIILIFCSQLFIQCKNNTEISSFTIVNKNVKYAKGFSFENYHEFTLLTVTNPWPKATKPFYYVLKKKNCIIPDSLKKFPVITVPLQKIIVTSTTHLPALEMLNEEKTLVGFPELKYISSNKIRTRIQLGKIKEVGKNSSLNTEVIIGLQPDAIIGHGIDNNNPTLDKLEKSGLTIMLNGDWNEPTPLGNAEWIKFFGLLYDKQKEADSLFSTIERNYLETVELAKKAISTPTLLAGDIYQDRWYMPRGESWVSLLFKKANGNYLWKNTKGSGSLSLTFEIVFEQGKDADIWFTSGQYTSLKEMAQFNPHYSEFKAFRKGNVYSFASKKEKKGGNLFYELGPGRPDIVLKDLIKILHPELLPKYKPYFYEKLK